MWSVTRYPLASPTAGASPGTPCVLEVAVTNAAAAPAPPKPAARRNLRRLVVLAVFICASCSRLRCSIQVERFGLDGEEGRAERGDLAVVIGLARARERAQQPADRGLQVGFEEAALLLHGGRAAAGASRDEHAHGIEDAGE